MKIEAGKYYRTRDGRKVGPMLPYSNYTYCWSPGGSGSQMYDRDGERITKCAEDDLVAEWQDEPTGPVVTETVKRIKPGHYGFVWVNSPPVDSRIDISIFSGTRRSAAELRAAAATLVEIADALDSGAA